MRPSRPLLWLLPSLIGLLGCPREEAGPGPVDAGEEAAPSGPIRVENLVGLELTLPSAWKRSPIEPADQARGLLFRARRQPLGSGAPPVAPSLAIARPAAADVEALAASTLEELRALEKQPGVELEKTSSGLRTLGGRSFRVVEVSYRVGGPAPSSLGFIQRSYLLATPEGPPEAQTLAFHLSHLAEDAEALGTELDVVLSGLQLTGPRIAVPGKTDGTGSGAEEE